MVQTRRVAAAVVAAVALASSARAISTTDRPASIQVWPKIVVDTIGQFTGGVTVNTLITLANADRQNITDAHCFYTNANSHCADNPNRVCLSSANCVSDTGVAECVPGWNEIDFHVRLTREQPLAWYASSGLQRGQFPIEGPFFCTGSNGTVQCEEDTFCVSLGYTGCDNEESNLGSGIPPVPEDPFIGALTCIQVTGDPPVPDHTDNRNALIGDATIQRRGAVTTDLSKYNAIGFRSGASEFGGVDTLLLDGREYDACPGTLILSHLFDNAIDPISLQAITSTELTLVPCGNDFATQTPGRSVAQFLVFNEFEQRFSTSRTVDCLLNTTISSIDTRNPLRSIFSAGVAGTIAGQTRIRGVGTSTTTGNALLGVAEYRLTVPSSTIPLPLNAAYNLHQQGSSSGDSIIVP